MDHEAVKNLLNDIGNAVCDKVHTSVREQSVDKLSAVYKEGKEDTVYQIDHQVEDVILKILRSKAEKLGGIVLIAQGMGNSGEPLVFPSNHAIDQAALRLIIDPIDGTRNIMYDKRSAFFLSGAAPNNGNKTMLSDIEVALMTELPTSRSYLSDTLWAIKGKGSFAQTRNLNNGKTHTKAIQPSRSGTILGGFAQLSRFFPPGREILSKIEDELIDTLFSKELTAGKAIIFEDQYISTGGQFYELLMGHDRFTADIRSLLYDMLEKKGVQPSRICHPYEVCTLLIMQETGLPVTDGRGKKLDAPFDLTAKINWIGYANTKIKNEVEPILGYLLKAHQLV